MLIAGVALFVLPDSVLAVSGASEPWELELVRWSGATLVLLSFTVAAAERQGNGVMGVRGTSVRQVVVAGFAAAYLLSAESFFLFMAFCALVHLTLHITVPVLEEVHGRAKTRAGYGGTTIARPGA